MRIQLGKTNETLEETLERYLSNIEKLKWKLENISSISKDEDEVSLLTEKINNLQNKKLEKVRERTENNRKISMFLKGTTIGTIVLCLMFLGLFNETLAFGLSAGTMGVVTVLTLGIVFKANVKEKILTNDINLFLNEIQTLSDERKKVCSLRGDVLDFDRVEVLAFIEHYEKLVYEILDNKDLEETEYVKEVRKSFYPDENRKLVKVNKKN